METTSDHRTEPLHVPKSEPNLQTFILFFRCGKTASCVFLLFTESTCFQPFPAFTLGSCIHVMVHDTKHFLQGQWDPVWGKGRASADRKQDYSHSRCFKFQSVLPFTLRSTFPFTSTQVRWGVPHVLKQFFCLKLFLAEMCPHLAAPCSDHLSSPRGFWTPPPQRCRPWMQPQMNLIHIWSFQQLQAPQQQDSSVWAHLLRSGVGHSQRWWRRTDLHTTPPHRAGAPPDDLHCRSSITAGGASTVTCLLRFLELGPAQRRQERSDLVKQEQHMVSP